MEKNGNYDSWNCFFPGKQKKRNKNSLLWPLWLISREETACYIREEVHQECFLGFFHYGELQPKVIGVTNSVWYPNVMLLDNRKHKKKITRCTHSKPVVIPLKQDTKTWNSNLNQRDSSFPHLRDQVAGGCRIHPEGCPGSEWKGWCWFWRHQTGHQHWLAWAQNQNTRTHTQTYNHWRNNSQLISPELSTCIYTRALFHCCLDGRVGEWLLFGMLLHVLPTHTYTQAQTLFLHRTDDPVHRRSVCVAIWCQSQNTTESMQM